MIEVVLDPNDIFVFAPDGRLVAAPARREGRAMARIDLVDLAHSYGGNPTPIRRLRAEADLDDAGARAAPTRCSGPRAAARPRCSTSSPACARRREGRVLFDGKDVTRAVDPASATSPRCSSSR